jgi:hypothetical protein
MFLERSLIALVLCAGVAGCAANPSPEATFFVPGTDTPIASSGPSWDMAVGPSPADWSYDPDLGGYTASGPWGSVFSGGVPNVGSR